MERIFNSIEQVKEHLPVNASFDFSSIKPMLLRAFKRTVLPHLTPGQYEAMCAALAVPLAPEATLEELNERESYEQLRFAVRCATANLAYMLYLPHGQVQVSDSGIHIASNANKKTAFQWQIKDLAKSFSDAGYEALEDMLRLLDENRALFAPWAESEAAKAYHRLFIASTDEFEQYQPLNGSRLLFKGLTALMMQVELLRTSRLLGNDLFKGLKDYAATGSVAAPQAELYASLLPLVKGSVANRALAEGIIRRSIQLSAEGTLQLNITDENGLKTAAPEILRQLQDRYTATAVEYEMLISELLRNGSEELTPLIDNEKESRIYYL
jgi:hypothetical protein